MTFSGSDLYHLSAAEGWLGLGDWRSADDELAKVSPEYRVHPAFLAVRFEVYSHSKQWDLALEVAETLVKLSPDEPQPWIHRSFCLHELKRTQEAEDLLLPSLQKFPQEPIIPYNLACYACQLGKHERARKLLAMAFERGDEKKIKLMALDDPDLAPLKESRMD